MVRTPSTCCCMVRICLESRSPRLPPEPNGHHDSSIPASVFISMNKPDTMDSFVSVDGAAETKPSIYDLHSDVYHDLHRNEIRLVKLLPGQWSDKICCQLYHTPLANRPSYKALSYAWGSPRATRPILVNGHQHSVTVNLECALRRLRRTDSDLILWVDALCINQKNDSERTEQVNLMHDIFAFTEEVVVYLGGLQQQGSKPPKKSLSSSTFNYDDSDREKFEVSLNFSVYYFLFRVVLGSVFVAMSSNSWNILLCKITERRLLTPRYWGTGFS